VLLICLLQLGVDDLYIEGFVVGTVGIRRLCMFWAWV
jgi:hypothetical protein